MNKTEKDEDLVECYRCICASYNEYTKLLKSIGIKKTYINKWQKNLAKAAKNETKSKNNDKNSSSDYLSDSNDNDNDNDNDSDNDNEESENATTSRKSKSIVEYKTESEEESWSEQDNSKDPDYDPLVDSKVKDKNSKKKNSSNKSKSSKSKTKTKTQRKSSKTKSKSKSRNKNKGKASSTQLQTVARISSKSKSKSKNKSKSKSPNKPKGCLKKSHSKTKDDPKSVSFKGEKYNHKDMEGKIIPLTDSTILTMTADEQYGQFRRVLLLADTKKMKGTSKDYSSNPYSVKHSWYGRESTFLVYTKRKPTGKKRKFSSVNSDSENENNSENANDSETETEKEINEPPPKKKQKKSHRNKNDSSDESETDTDDEMPTKQTYKRLREKEIAKQKQIKQEKIKIEKANSSHKSNKKNSNKNKSKSKSQSQSSRLAQVTKKTTSISSSVSSNKGFFCYVAGCDPANHQITCGNGGMSTVYFQINRDDWAPDQFPTTPQLPDIRIRGNTKDYNTRYNLTIAKKLADCIPVPEYFSSLSGGILSFYVKLYYNQSKGQLGGKKPLTKDNIKTHYANASSQGKAIQMEAVNFVKLCELRYRQTGHTGIAAYKDHIIKFGMGSKCYYIRKVKKSKYAFEVSDKGALVFAKFQYQVDMIFCECYCIRRSFLSDCAKGKYNEENEGRLCYNHNVQDLIIELNGGLDYYNKIYNDKGIEIAKHYGICKLST